MLVGPGRAGETSGPAARRRLRTAEPAHGADSGAPAAGARGDGRMLPQARGVALRQDDALPLCAARHGAQSTQAQRRPTAAHLLRARQPPLCARSAARPLAHPAAARSGSARVSDRLGRCGRGRPARGSGGVHRAASRGMRAAHSREPRHRVTESAGSLPGRGAQPVLQRAASAARRQSRDAHHPG